MEMEMENGDRISFLYGATGRVESRGRVGVNGRIEEESNVFAGGLICPSEPRRVGDSLSVSAAIILSLQYLQKHLTWTVLSSLFDTLYIHADIYIYIYIVS